MTIDWLPSKRDLGVMYLVGVGFIFTVIVFREAFGVASPTLEELLTLSAAFFLAIGLIAVGYWLFQSPLGDDRVLVVSEWGGPSAWRCRPSPSCSACSRSRSGRRRVSSSRSSGPVASTEPSSAR